MNGRRIRGAIGIVIGSLCLALPAFALDPGQPAAVVTPIISATETAAGQPIVLPQTDVRVIASRFEIAPGAALPVHKHPYQRYAYVLAGTLEVTDIESGESTIYKAGDFIVEVVDRWHRGKNVGADKVELIVVDQVSGDVQQTILRK